MTATIKDSIRGGIGRSIVPFMIVLLLTQAGITFFWRGANPVIFLLVLMSLTILATAFLGDQFGRFDIRQPWSLLQVFHFPFWIVGSWNFALDDAQRSGLLIGAEHQINRALLLLSLGFTCLALGYRVGVAFRPRFLANTPRMEWDLSKMLMLGVVAYLACWYIRIGWYRSVLVKPYFDVLGGDAVSTVVRVASTTLPNFMVVGAWTMAYYLRNNRPLYGFCLLLTLCEVSWGLLYAVMKSLIFLPVFLPVLPYMIMRNKVPLLRIAAVAALLIGVAYPYVDAVRDQYFQPNGPTRPDAIEKVLEDGFGRFALQRESVATYSQKAMDRVSGLSSLCQALQMDEDGTLDINGAFYWRAIVGLVPRMLWPGKPIIHEGGYFSAYVEGQRGLDDVDLSLVTSSVAPTLFGSFFWNLGWWGVVLSSLALGILSGIAYRVMIAGQLSHPATVIYYMALLTCLETTETEVAKIPSNLVWGLAMAWLAHRIFQQKAPKPLQVTRHAKLSSASNPPGPATATTPVPARD